MANRRTLMNFPLAYLPTLALLIGLVLLVALQSNSVQADHDPQTTSISCTASGSEVTCTLTAPENLPIAFSSWFLNGVLVGDFDGSWESLNHSASHTFTPDCGDTTVAANGVYVDDDTIQHHVATAQTTHTHSCPTPTPGSGSGASGQSSGSSSGASGHSERAEQSAASRPGRAHNLTAAQSGNSVALSWSAPTDGGTVTSYRIWRRLPKRGERKLIVLVNNTGSAATSYTDSNAQLRQKHIYRVQALGSGGEGQRSLPAQIIVRP